MIRYISLLLLLVVTVAVYGNSSTNLIKNPNVIAKEPGRYSHWAIASVKIKNIPNGIEVIPLAKDKRAVIFQKMIPAPEKDYIFTCEFFVPDSQIRARVYAEEQRYDNNKKILYKGFRPKGKIIPGQWNKVEINVKLEPGWKDFYVAITAIGGSCKVRNMFFTRVVKGK